jgi:hypothetical protein
MELTQGFNAFVAVPKLTRDEARVVLEKEGRAPLIGPD